MNLPYSGPIEGFLKPGYTISIQGITTLPANRFAINLQTGPSISPRDDVAFHFSPDFNRFAVVRNSILQNRWGPEESVGPFPFARGAPFEILIVCEPEMYKVLVNGRELTTFEHRIAFSKVTHIAIDGDINLEAIKFNQNSQSDYGFNMNSTPYPQGPSMGQFAPPYPVGKASFPSTPAYSPIPADGGLYPAPGSYPQQHGGSYPPPSGGSYPTMMAGGYPTPGVAYPPSVGTHPHQPPDGAYPHSGGSYPHQPAGGAYPGGPYPQQHPGGAFPQHPVGAFAGQPLYPGATPGAPNLQNQSSGHKSGGILDKAGMALAGAMGGAGLLGSVGLGKKALKSQKKAHKKALKYGVPIAGVGLGAYALKKGIGGFWSSSSDSD